LSWSILTISGGEKKSGKHILPSQSPSFDSSKNVQGHVPLFSFFLSCVVGLFCVVFLPVFISLSSFPCGFPFLKINLKKERNVKRRECVCACIPSPTGAVQKKNPKSSIREKENHLNARCVRRRHVHSVRKPKFATQFRDITSQEIQLKCKDDGEGRGG